MSERAIQNGYLIAAQSDIENLRARIAALEEVVRAADRMFTKGDYIVHYCLRSNAMIRPTDELHAALDDYRSKRAALGEIGD